MDALVAVMAGKPAHHLKKCETSAEQGQEMGVIRGLFDVVGCPSGNTFFTIPFHGLGGQRNDREAF